MTTTSNTPWTPGPWLVANGLQVWHRGHNTVESPRICTLLNAAHPVNQIDRFTMVANARLIAAAPEMAEVINDLIASMMFPNLTSDEAAESRRDTKRRARAVLAAVRGEG